MNIPVFLYFVVSSVLLDRQLNRTIVGLSYIGGFLIFLFMALRYGYGNDYFNYANLHSYYTSYGNWEFGFEYFYKKLNTISANFQYVILAHSLIFMVAFFLLGTALKRLGCNLSVVAFLFFMNPYLYLIHLSALRQSFAVCLFVSFISLFLMYRRYLFVILAVTLPMLFHKAAIVYIIFVPFCIFSGKIYSARWYSKTIYFLVGIYLISLAFEFGLSGTFLKYSVYVERSFGGRISLTTLLYFLFVTFLFLTSKPCTALDVRSLKVYQILHALVYVSLILTAFSLFFQDFSRVALFFDFFLPFYFACSKFLIPRNSAYILLILIYIIRNFTFLNSEIYFNGFGVYRIFLFP